MKVSLFLLSLSICRLASAAELSPTLELLLPGQVDDELREARRAADELKKPWDVRWECEYRGQPGYRCVARDKATAARCGAWTYLSPFPVEVTGDTECSDFSAEFGWAAPDEVRDGRAVLAAYQKGLQSGLTACAGPRCQVVLKTNTVETAEGPISGLAQCTIDRIAKALGAPGDCKVVALQTAQGYRLRVVRRFVPTLGMMGVPDFDFALYATRKVDVDRLLPLIREKLAEKPLSLSVDPKSAALRSSRGDAVLGVATHRRSGILDLWEWVTVRVDHYAPKGLGPLKVSGMEFGPQAEFSTTLTLMVSKRNTPEYRVPTEGEFLRYLEVVRAAVGLGVEEICEQSNWVDARTVVCVPR